MASYASSIDQTREPWLDKAEVSVTHSENCHMTFKKKVPFAPVSPFLVSADLVRFPGRPKVVVPNDEGPSRMSDEGCPNESPSVKDATGYSTEEEEEN
jgi:hypothetical protein